MSKRTIELHKDKTRLQNYLNNAPYKYHSILTDDNIELQKKEPLLIEILLLQKAFDKVINNDIFSFNNFCYVVGINPATTRTKIIEGVLLDITLSQTFKLCDYINSTFSEIRKKILSDIQVTKGQQYVKRFK